MCSPAKILLFTADFPPDINGVGDYTAQLAAALHDIECDVSVLTGPLNDQVEPSWSFPVLRPFANWADASIAKVVAIADAYDVVHIQYPGVALGRSMLPNLLPAALRKRWPKTVATFHEFRSMRTRWRARASIMLRGLDRALVVDGSDAALMKRWSRLVRPITGPPPVEAVPIAPNIPVILLNAAEREAQRQLLGIKPDEIALVYFGIFYPHKGVDVLLDAAEHLNKRGVRARPVIVGNFDRPSAWRREMEQRLSASGVTWVQNATAEEVSGAMHAGDIAVLPYGSGAGPNRSSLLTALQHSLPTITTDGPSTPPDFLTTGGVVFVPPADIGAVTQSLQEIIENTALRQRLSDDAQHAAGAFSWPGIAAQHAELYQWITENR